jgi:hypothetical protein
MTSANRIERKWHHQKRKTRERHAEERGFCGAELWVI